MALAAAVFHKQAPRPLKMTDGQLRLLPEIHRVLYSRAGLKDCFEELVILLSKHICLNCGCVTLYDSVTGQLRVYLQCAPGAGNLLPQHFAVSVEGSPCGEAFSSGQPVVMPRLNLKRYPSEYTRRMTERGLRSGCSIPLTTPNNTLGTLCFGSMKASAFRPSDTALLTYLAHQVALILENELAAEALDELKQRLTKEIEDSTRFVKPAPTAVADEPPAQLSGHHSAPRSRQTLREVERDYIMTVLRETHGVLGGAGGAAARLGLKRTTLQYKMQRLGIKRKNS